MKVYILICIIYYNWKFLSTASLLLMRGNILYYNISEEVKVEHHINHKILIFKNKLLVHAAGKFKARIQHKMHVEKKN